MHPHDMHSNVFGASVANVDEPKDMKLVVLPLDIIAKIISHLDDVSDLARICRTSRVLYYLTVPQLYSTLSIRSYSEIHYVNDEPAGVGGASPFIMALQGLATRALGSLVHEFHLKGEWKEYDIDTHVQTGRIPDHTMMLSVLVRLAVEKMDKIQSFRWELNTKPLKTVYLGLAGSNTLRNLYIRYPTARIPRPTVLLPPFPNLRSFSAIDIDPLAYPDDISLLLLESKKLEELVLHWNPRIRESLEPSVNLRSLFGRCLHAGYSMKINRISIYNLYAFKEAELEKAFSTSVMREVTLIQSGESPDLPQTAFMDQRMDTCPDQEPPPLRFLKTDLIAKKHARTLSETTGLEELYLINSFGFPFIPSDSLDVPLPNIEMTPPISNSHGSTPTESSASSGVRSSLLNDYLNAITKNHGHSLKRLLLPDKWVLGQQDLAAVVRSAPNLTELGLALELENFEILRLLITFLPKLYALRILINYSSETSRAFFDNLSDDEIIAHSGAELAQPGYERLKFIGIGKRITETFGTVEYPGLGDDGGPIVRRIVKIVPSSRVKDISIWYQDSPAVA